MNSSIRRGLMCLAVLSWVWSAAGALAQSAICTQLQKLVPSDGTTTDNFGNAVAADGDLIVVGARLDDDRGRDSGSAYVYRWNGAMWVLEQKLLASDGLSGDFFGGSVAVDGDVIVVGATGRDTFAADDGAAYVFRWNGASWVQQVQVKSSDPDQFASFGSSVAISGDFVVVGAHLDRTSGVFFGSAYTFHWNGTVWTSKTKLLAFDRAMGDLFGTSVSISGTSIVVGAPGDDSASLLNTGSAYVYGWNGTAWVHKQKIVAFDAAATDELGESVAISGDLIVAGSRLDDDFGSNSGSAYAFRWNGTSWVLEQKLRATDGAASDFFGDSVAADGDAIVVGSNGDDDRGSASGSAYAFHWNGASWVEHKLLASDGAAADSFGSSVTVSGDVIAVGSPLDDDRGLNSGSAYVYSCEQVGNTPPVITCPEPVLFEFAQGASVTLAADVEDADGDGLTVTWYVNNILAEVDNVSAAGPPTQATVTFEQAYDLGVHVVTVIVDDGEFTAECGTVVTVQDTTPPVIICLEDVEVETDPGECFASGVDLGLPEVSDNYQVESITNDAPATFLHGETIVTWTVTDTSGNEATCMQLVTVIDLEPPMISGFEEGLFYPKVYNTCAAVINNLPVPDVSDNCEVASMVSDAPAEFPVGVTRVTWTAMDDSGNTATHEVMVTITNELPVAVCAQEAITVEAVNSSGASVQLDASGSFDPDDADLFYQWSVSDVTLDDGTSATPSGVFPIGITMATVTVSDGCGAWDTCDVVVTVEDTTPPEVMCSTSVDALWPPNHEMVEVTLYIFGTDAVADSEDIIPLSVIITSDEPDDATGNGDGATTGDINGSAGAVEVVSLFTFDAGIGPSGAWKATVQLRAERQGNGVGRCYKIDVIAIDSSDNEGRSSCCVVVPHSRGRGGG